MPTTLYRCYFPNFVLPRRTDRTLMLTCRLQRDDTDTDNDNDTDTNCTQITNNFKSLAYRKQNITKTIAANSNNNSSNNSNNSNNSKRKHNRNSNHNSVTHCNCKNNINRFAESANRTVNKKKILLATVVCVPTAWVNDINLTPPKQSKLSLTLTWTLPLPLQFLAALVQLLLVTTNHKSELHHMLCDLTIQRHTVAITYDLSLSGEFHSFSTHNSWNPFPPTNQHTPNPPHPPTTALT